VRIRLGKVAAIRVAYCSNHFALVFYFVDEFLIGYTPPLAI